jgi:hypothetical protein
VRYGFDKLYLDVVTDDGTVCIVYLTWTEVLGLRSATAGFELYPPNGSREVVHARRAPAPPDLAAPEWRVELDVPGGPLEVRHTARSEGWTPAGGFPAVDWSVKTARAEVEARWLGDPSRPVLRGRGYADWVSLRKITRRLNMRRVTGAAPTWATRRWSGTASSRPAARCGRARWPRAAPSATRATRSSTAPARTR